MVDDLPGIKDTKSQKLKHLNFGTGGPCCPGKWKVLVRVECCRYDLPTEFSSLDAARRGDLRPECAPTAVRVKKQ